MVYITLGTDKSSVVFYIFISCPFNSFPAGSNLKSRNHLTKGNRRYAQPTVYHLTLEIQLLSLGRFAYLSLASFYNSYIKKKSY